MQLKNVDNIYALFIGINEYPHPRHKLKGCVEDVSAMRTFVNQFCNENSIKLHEKVLENEAATRNNIIDAFDHYKLVMVRKFPPQESFSIKKRTATWSRLFALIVAKMEAKT